MDSDCVIAQCDTDDKMRLALEVLEKAGFTNNDVTTVRSREQWKHSGVPVQGEDMAPDVPPEESAVTTSTVVGGALGATVGAVTLIGPLLVAGPLAGLALGAAAGGLMNLVGGRGVDKSVSDAYEKAVAEGSSLVIVTGDSARLNRAERVLRTIAPQSIHRFSTENK